MVLVVEILLLGTCLPYTVHAMAIDDLVTQGAKASTAIYSVLT